MDPRTVQLEMSGFTRKEVSGGADYVTAGLHNYNTTVSAFFFTSVTSPGLSSLSLELRTFGHCDKNVWGPKRKRE